jgi:hypothetical protein
VLVARLVACLVCIVFRYMPTTGSGSSWITTTNIANFSACVDLCDDYTNSEGGACQWLTYVSARTCQARGPNSSWSSVDCLPHNLVVKHFPAWQY